MSFTSRLVESALRDGNTAAQVRASAQRNANATWFWAAIAAVTWYVAGWAWALVPGAVAALKIAQSISATLTAIELEKRGGVSGQRAVPRSTALPPRIDLDNFEHVAAIDRVREEYSALLSDETRPHARCMFRSVEELPYAKETIRRALTELLEFAQGRRASRLLDSRLRNPEVASVVQVALIALDTFVDVPLKELPSEPAENARVGTKHLGEGAV